MGIQLELSIIFSRILDSHHSPTHSFVSRRRTSRVLLTLLRAKCMLVVSLGTIFFLPPKARSPSFPNDAQGECFFCCALTPSLAAPAPWSGRGCAEAPFPHSHSWLGTCSWLGRRHTFLPAWVVLRTLSAGGRPIAAGVELAAARRPRVL